MSRGSLSPLMSRAPSPGTRGTGGGLGEPGWDPGAHSREARRHVPMTPGLSPSPPPPSRGPGPAQLALPPLPTHRGGWGVGTLVLWLSRRLWGAACLTCRVGLLSFSYRPQSCATQTTKDHPQVLGFPPRLLGPPVGQTPTVGTKPFSHTPLARIPQVLTPSKHPGSCLRVTWGWQGGSWAGTNTQRPRSAPPGPSVGPQIPSRVPMAFLPRPPQVRPGPSQCPGLASVGQRGKAL